MASNKRKANSLDGETDTTLLASEKRLKADSTIDASQPESPPADDDDVPVESTVPPVCPYLDTINRKLLDFDFEQLCSVTLSPHHVYCCLVCGRYFQGRGKQSIAFFHSVHTSHHVFINLHTRAIFCLPDGYEVHDPSLHDIQFNLQPTYTGEEVRALDQWQVARGLDGVEYIVGLMGLNDIKQNDWLNVVVQALMRVTPLRDYCLLSLPALTATPLLRLCPRSRPVHLSRRPLVLRSLAPLAPLRAAGGEVVQPPVLQGACQPTRADSGHHHGQ